MKRILWLFFFIMVLVLFLFIYDSCNKKEQFVSTYSLTQDEKNLLQDGDIILRHGYGFVSNTIVKTLNEKYHVSHCGIICRDSNQLNVIHTVSQSVSDFDGIQSHSFGKFIKDSQINSLMVVRYKPPVNKDLSMISAKAKLYLKQKIPFDHAFNLEDSTEFYCTELIWRIILSEFNQDIYPNRKNKNNDHLKFEALWDTAKFEIVLNHHKHKPDGQVGKDK